MVGFPTKSFSSISYPSFLIRAIICIALMESPPKPKNFSFIPILLTPSTLPQTEAMTCSTSFPGASSCEFVSVRSEERRVGKVCRIEGATEHDREKSGSRDGHED